MMLPETILRERVIPVGRGLNESRALRLVEALAAGGINSLEITMESPEAVGAIVAVAGSDFTVGAGTVMSVSDAERAVSAGAEFVVSPHLDVNLVQWALNNEVAYIPGVLSPTEVATAWKLRPTAVKVFPANLGGPGYLRSLLGPFPDLRVIPTGGVNGENVVDFLRSGAVAVGVGGWLTTHDDLAIVTERALALRSKVV